MHPASHPRPMQPQAIGTPSLLLPQRRGNQSIPADESYDKRTQVLNLCVSASAEV